MHFSINRDYFINQLNHVARAIPGKAAIPVLTGMKLELKSDRLILTGSDASISIESVIETSQEAAQLQVTRPGSIVLSARLFIDIVRKLPTNQVEIEVQDHYNVQLTSGKAVFTIQGVDSSQYPVLPETDEDKPVTLPGLLFKKLINQTFHDGYLTGVATDSHRLSKRDIPIKDLNPSLKGLNITIPKKTVIELTRILDDETNVTFYVMAQQLVFHFDNLVIYSRLLEGTFPDTSRLIPTTYNTELTVNTQSFSQALERAALLVHVAKSNVVQLKMSQGSVALLVQGISIGQSTEELSYDSLEGDDLTIAFNPDYMRDAVKSFGDTTIKLGFISGERPLLLREDKVEEGHNDLIQLLTPIRTHHA